MLRSKFGTIFACTIMPRHYVITKQKEEQRKKKSVGDLSAAGLVSGRIYVSIYELIYAYIIYDLQLFPLRLVDAEVSCWWLMIFGGKNLGGRISLVFVCICSKRVQKEKN